MSVSCRRRTWLSILERSLRKYQNRAIETAAVIEELIELAKEIREAQDPRRRLGLTDD